MSEVSHTPAPWFIDEDPPPFTGDITDAIVVSYGNPITGLAIIGRGNGKVGGIANARLISAAPDLLAACEKLLRRATPFTNHWKDDPELVEAYAAIAKARGQNAS